MAQQKLLDDLREDLAKGGVLVVAGTGVSIQATKNQPCASWKGLILDGIDHCVNTNLLPEAEAVPLRGRLDGNDPKAMIDVAETISSSLGAPGGEFGRWLVGSVGRLNLRDRDIVESIHSLGAPIATTNYDDLLTRGRGLDAVPWTDVAAAHQLIHGDRDGVLHFHGVYRQPESVILGVRSYEKLLASREAQAIQQAVAATRTLLFIGCGDGLSDPNFGSLLDWIAAAFGKSIYRHYCLCRNDEQEALQKRYPPGKRLSYIAYGDDYGELAPFLRDELAAKTARKPTLANIPNPGYCIGREREVEEAVSALLAENPQPLPILGGPGMGKTTIALKALHDRRVANRFGARRWFIRCDGVKTRAELAAAIAQALGIPITPNVEEAIVRALDAAPAALVLDNAETPLDANQSEVEELLARLATIESLALVATIRKHTTPAGVPWRSTLEAERLDADAAKEAFIKIAGKPQFANDPHLDRLLSVLDGMPLAIALMARYAQAHESLEPVWERWTAKRTAMLKEGKGDNRLRNISVSYDLSIAVLSPPARRLLSVLAMLPDGVAHSDLSNIFDDPDDAVHELHARALVFDEAKRLRMLAPLREYVAAAHAPEKVDESRVVEHYLALARLGSMVGKADGSTAVSRLAPEVGNVETMLSRSGRYGYKPIAAAAYGWAKWMRFTGLGSVQVVEQIADRALAADNSKDAAQCIDSLGNIALIRSDYEAARARFEQALSLYQRIDNPLGKADCIQSLGRVALYLSDAELARTHLEQALSLYQEIGNTLGEANCLQCLGDLDLHRLDYEAAWAHYERALPLFQKIEDPLGEANCTHGLGEIALVRSEFKVAQTRLDQALSLYQKIGDMLGEANCLHFRGEIARLIGKLDESEALYRRSLALYERIPERYSIGLCHLSLARIATETCARSEHVAAARAAWLSIKRDDLVAKLDQEFSASEPVSPESKSPVRAVPSRPASRRRRSPKKT